MSQGDGLAVVVFSDLVDSTALLARLGDDRMEELRRAHLNDVTQAVAGAGGRLIKTLGDGTMASFESALGALRAAARIQASVERLDSTQGRIGIEARVGVAAGEPIAHGEDLHGMTVVIASRLCSAAASGEVLVHELVAALVASRDGFVLGPPESHELKGVPTSVRAMKLEWRELVPDEHPPVDRRPPSQDADGQPIGDENAGGQPTGHIDADRRPIVGEALRRQGADSGPAQADAQPSGQVTQAGPPQGIPLPQMLAAYAAEPLIGRDREIGLLRQATAPRQGSRAVLVLGEPGIGKTRHAAAAAGEARTAGAVVVLARCPPEPTIAFEPWVRAIGELASAGDAGWCGGLAVAAGAELAALVPELGGGVVHAGQAAAEGQRPNAAEVVVAEGARYRLLHGIAGALAHATGEAPLHVVLDDAHWCDAASAQALGRLLETPPPAGIVVVVTARERELGRRHPVTKVLGELRRTGDLTELRLQGLDAGGLAALVAARVGRSITPRLAARLQARTAGNPFFAAELVRDLDERGALRSEEELEAAPAPDAVADLVEERLGRLDPTTERLLAAAAAIGPSASVALAAKTAGLDEPAAAVAVGQAVAERLVDDVPAAQPTIAFPHALIREALTAGTDEATRARLHLAAARALEEQPEAEPAELARHYGMAVSVAGPEAAIAAYRRAAEAATAAHDHEQAAAQLRRALALIAGSDFAVRAPLLLELGEQQLLAADLARAREAFRAAADAARAIGDAGTLARAALGFAGGDVGFGFELNGDDSATVPLLREGLDALGEHEPRLALRMISALTWALLYTDEDQLRADLAERAQRLYEHLGDAEAQVLAGLAQAYAAGARSEDPLRALDRLDDFIELSDAAQRSGREDLLFRTVQWSAVAHYRRGRVGECERAVERAAEIAGRLGSPRFTWEVELYRGHRLLDRGDRAGGEALVRSAGATVRRLRPDIHVVTELATLLLVRWFYDGDTSAMRGAYEAMELAFPGGLISGLATMAAALEGDRDGARRRLASLLSDDLAAVRRPDIHMPATLTVFALAAARVEDRSAAERLLPPLQRLRPSLIAVVPFVAFSSPHQWSTGRLQMLNGRLDAAVEELSAGLAMADELDLVAQSALLRIDLAVALGRRDQPGDRERAQALLVESEAIAEQHGMRLIETEAARARADLQGREPAQAVPAQTAPAQAERARPLRSLAARGGRRALASWVHGQDGEALERRFCDPRRQRALVHAMTRGFQPARAGGFSGVIVYELEPYAIEPPPEAPWRWAIEVDARAGKAKLIEPAPLDAAVTIRFGLAEWVRTIAGVQSSIAAMAAGRCSVEGDVLLAARLEAMFGAR